MVNKIESADFENEVLKNSKPVFVDFFAEWCVPCQMLGPIVEEISNGILADKVDFAKLDIDKAIEIAGKYEVMSVPTMIIFKDGKEVTRLIGLQPKENIEEIIENAIA
ncbi:MAG: thioredoxin [Ruminococcus sp.]|nr:thioredoxin [Ruminococcus sp.]